MDPRTFPTKGNLMLAKNSLTLAKQGYDLMDKKRNILIRELMDLIDEARDIQDEIDSTFTHAYECLQRANIEHGINMVAQLAYTVPIENSITIQTRSIMGTEIPHVRYTPANEMPTYSFSTTRESIDQATKAFQKVKDLTVKLSMVENAAYRLATNIKKTQKRNVQRFWKRSKKMRNHLKMRQKNFQPVRQGQKEEISAHSEEDRW